MPPKLPRGLLFLTGATIGDLQKTDDELYALAKARIQKTRDVEREALKKAAEKLRIKDEKEIEDEKAKLAKMREKGQNEEACKKKQTKYDIKREEKMRKMEAKRQANEILGRAMLRLVGLPVSRAVSARASPVVENPADEQEDPVAEVPEEDIPTPREEPPKDDTTEVAVCSEAVPDLPKFVMDQLAQQIASHLKESMMADQQKQFAALASSFQADLLAQGWVPPQPAESEKAKSEPKPDGDTEKASTPTGSAKAKSDAGSKEASAMSKKSAKSEPKPEGGARQASTPAASEKAKSTGSKKSAISESKPEEKVEEVKADEKGDADAGEKSVALPEGMVQGANFSSENHETAVQPPKSQCTGLSPSARSTLISADKVDLEGQLIIKERPAPSVKEIPEVQVIMTSKPTDATIGAAPKLRQLVAYFSSLEGAKSPPPAVVVEVIPAQPAPYLSPRSVDTCDCSWSSHSSWQSDDSYQIAPHNVLLPDSRTQSEASSSRPLYAGTTLAGGAGTSPVVDAFSTYSEYRPAKNVDEWLQNME